MKIDILRLREEDFNEALLELIEIYSDGYGDLERYHYKKRRDIRSYIKWLYKVDPFGFLVGYVDGKRAGFIAGSRRWNDSRYGDISEIHELVVRSSFKGKEVSDRLLEALLGLYKGRIVGLWVGEENHRAIRFYKRYGFVETGKVGIWIRMIREER